MYTLRKDFLHALEKECNRQTMFGEISRERQTEFENIIKDLKEAVSEPDKWRVLLIVEKKQ
jgi:hypothetical protein